MVFVEPFGVACFRGFSHPEEGGAGTLARFRNGHIFPLLLKNSMEKHACSMGMLNGRAKRSIAFLFQDLHGLSTGLSTRLSTVSVEKRSLSKSGFSGVSAPNCVKRV